MSEPSFGASRGSPTPGKSGAPSGRAPALPEPVPPISVLHDLALPARGLTGHSAGDGQGHGSLRAYPLLLPLVVLVAVFGVYPALQSLWLALHSTDGPEVVAFQGLANFTRLAGDPRFFTALANTGLFVAGSLAIQVPLALAVALYLDAGRSRRRRALRYAFVLPHLVGGPFAAVLFTVLLGPRSGAVNKLFGWINHGFPGLGLPTDTRWLDDPSLTLPVTLFIGAWLSTGLNLLLLLGGLRMIDRGLYEAARLDGAGPWARFRAITLPGLAPVLTFVCVLDAALAFRVFEMPWILLGGTAGPNDAGLFLTTYLYETGFVQGDLGYASAIGWVLTVAMVGIALVFRLIGRTEGQRGGATR